MATNVYPIDKYRQPSTPDVVVSTEGDGDSQYDPETQTVTVPLDDGAVEVSFGHPRPKPQESKDFDDNLAEYLSESELSQLGERTLLQIEQDIQSRQPWLENMSSGISLLGLEMKNPRGAATSGATPQEGVSTVDHPLLLESVLRFQANAVGELLPTDGPVKVRNDGEDNTLAEKLANALEKDLNHYLTKVATEYYPDTDRMLLLTGFSGIGFKKGFHCPIRRRPVIESIAAKDLIVSNAATNIEGAGRVTHAIRMRPSVLRRMQLLGAYRDIRLPTMGTPVTKNPVDTKIDMIQGIVPATYVEPEDQERDIYECYTEIEVPGFEHKLKGKETGLPLPYKVSIDKDSRQILEIRRNWEESDEFCLPRNRIVAYIFVPGLGFYGIGLLNVLGNATKAVTAAWRLMIDAGMFANFPGFLYLKSLAKQQTNQFRVPPGGGMAIDNSGGITDISKAVMPLPYKDPSAVFIQLIENVVSAARQVGGTAEMQIGEGKQDAPVGTTLALIEQATKLMGAVHKRLHQAQGAEFQMLKSLLQEDPEALWRHNKKSAVLKMLVAEAGQQPVADEEEAAETRHRALFLAALADCELMPAADPNTSSQTERYLKATAIRQMAATNPGIDMNAVDMRVFQILGIDDADTLFKPPPEPGQQQPPSPEEITAQATIMAAQARLKDSETKSQQIALKAQTDTVARRENAQIKASELASRERIASLGVARELVVHNSEQERAKNEMSNSNDQADADREHQLALARHSAATDAASEVGGRAHDIWQSMSDQQHEASQGVSGQQHEMMSSALDRSHQMVGDALNHNRQMISTAMGNRHQAVQSALNLRHQMMQKAADRQHQLTQGVLGQQHEMAQGAADREHEAQQNDLDRATQQAKPKGVAPQ